MQERDATQVLTRPALGAIPVRGDGDRSGTGQAASVSHESTLFTLYALTDGSEDSQAAIAES